MVLISITRSFWVIDEIWIRFFFKSIKVNLFIKLIAIYLNIQFTILFKFFFYLFILLLSFRKTFFLNFKVFSSGIFSSSSKYSK
jgi:hypothetical protein